MLNPTQHPDDAYSPDLTLAHHECLMIPETDRCHGRCACACGFCDWSRQLVDQKAWLAAEYADIERKKRYAEQLHAAGLDRGYVVPRPARRSRRGK